MSMFPQPPPGQGPIDPRGAFAPPSPPGASPQMPPGAMIPPMMPPMMPPMPPPWMMAPPREKSFARSIFTALAVSIFSLSIGLNLYLLLYSGLMQSQSSSREEVIISGDTSQQIAAIPVNGIIDDSAAMQLDKYLTRFEKDASIKAVVIEVDSPGGTVSASDQMHHRISEFRKKKSVPVVIAMGGLAASGGYYISCGADYIFAEPTTLTGSIGVIGGGLNFSELMQKWGVKDTTIVSSGATFKNAGSMYSPESPEQRQYLQQLIDRMFDRFKKVVVDGRKSIDPAGLDRIANGKVFTAHEALELKLIDEIGYKLAAYDKAASLASLSNKHVVRYSESPTFLQALGVKSGAPAPSSAVTINGVNVNVDRSLLYDLAIPRPMYLWTGQ